MDQKNGEGGLSNSQVRNCYSLCDRVLEKAVAEKLIVRNPAKGYKLPPNRPNDEGPLPRGYAEGADSGQGGELL